MATPLDGLISRIESLTTVDRVADPLAERLSSALRRTGADRLLTGAWLGHAVHPALTDLPIGSWTSAMVLDLVGGVRARPAATALVGVGIATAIPTAATGAADWSSLGGRDRRTGFVHGASNTVALACYVASFVARRRGHHARGVVLGLAGAAAASVAGALGGHLVYKRGSGVHTGASD